MRLEFKRFDGRAPHSIPVIDQDTGKEVGYVGSYGVGPYKTGGMRVCLFGGKYDIYLNRYDQCWGFVKGVEAVLSHMTMTDVHVPEGVEIKEAS